ncbi:hypothetical protein BD769DRAFT_1677130 [Suillus cothurnatus]|nr:hypothetical protein BD769DRAFT_1677130 [Suillus cothurnatus]
MSAFLQEDIIKLGKRPSTLSILLANLYFQRRTFVKRDKPREIRTPALTTTQDPEGKFLHIQDNWNVVHPLDIADLTSDGKILPMDAILLTEGDFVDVGAELDFVLSRQRHKPTTLKCFLTCTHIVRMIPAHYVQRMQLYAEPKAHNFPSTTGKSKEEDTYNSHVDEE